MLASPPQKVLRPLALSARTGTVALFGEVLFDVFPDRRMLGGAPFNVARHLRAFGLNPVLISRTGTDASRDTLIATMTKLGMNTQGVQSDPSHPTGQVMVHMENGGHRFEILPEQAYDFIDGPSLLTTVTTTPPELIYFGTLAQRRPAARQALESLLKHGNAPRMLDINLREPWYDVQTLEYSLRQADILKLNNEELQKIAHLLNLEGNKETQWANGLKEQFGLQNILITRGEQGACLLDEQGTYMTVPAGEHIALVDTVGAGDGFASVFILGIFKHWTAEQSLMRADDFARAICGIRGAIPLDDSFYDPFRKAWALTDAMRP